MNQDHHYIIVTFSTNPENQPQALEDIGSYIESFLSQQPGFISSGLFASRDGNSIVHHAKWTNEAAFQQAAVLAREHTDLSKLMAYNPSGIGYELSRTFS